MLPINRLLCTQLINQRVCSCSSDIKSAVAFFKSDLSFQLLDFLLFRRQRLALRSNAGALLLKLINPATRRGLDNPERTAGELRHCASLHR
jgi:hypothetical protein